MCNGLTGNRLPSPLATLNSPFARTDVEQNIYDILEAQRNLPNLGNVMFEVSRREALMDLKEHLDELLAPGATFLDLSGHSAYYFYFNRPLMIQEAAFYNAPSSAMQEKILARIKENPPAVVLIDGDINQHDGGSASLRANLIYRYFCLNYVPIKRGEFIFLVNSDYAAKLQFWVPSKKIIVEVVSDDLLANDKSCDTKKAVVRFMNRIESNDVGPGDALLFAQKYKGEIVKVDNGLAYLHFDNSIGLHVNGAQKVEIVRQNMSQFKVLRTKKYELLLLEKAFNVDSLLKIPVSWGRSWGQLSSKLTPVAHYETVKNGPSVTIDFARKTAVQNEIAYLSFDISFPKEVTQVEFPGIVSWKENGDIDIPKENRIRFTAINGRMLLPLDVNPRWLLAENVTQVNIQIGVNEHSPDNVSIKNVNFYKRRGDSL
jgi:hypothetical protein